MEATVKKKSKKKVKCLIPSPPPELSKNDEPEEKIHDDIAEVSDDTLSEVIHQKEMSLELKQGSARDFNTGFTSCLDENSVLFASKANAVANKIEIPLANKDQEVAFLGLKEGFYESLAAEIDKVNECIQQESDIPLNNLYPSAKTIEPEIQLYHQAIMEHCSQFVSSSKQCVDENLTKFYQELKRTDLTDFADMVKKYETARQRLLCLQSESKCTECMLADYDQHLWVDTMKRISAQGKCDDGYVVNFEHEYNVKVLRPEVHLQIISAFSKLEKSILPDLTFHGYTVQLLNLKIDHEIYEAVKVFPFIKKLEEKGVDIKQAYDMSYEPALSKIRKYVTVLFDFQRRSTADEEFVENTRKWLSDLMTILVQFGSYSDNLFLLNHILRCPSGISCWAVSFIQLSGFPEADVHVNSEQFHFCLTALFMILSPVPRREEFLARLPKTNGPRSRDSFTIINCEGEEIEEKFKFEMTWTEADVTALLKQIPISFFYRCFLHMSLRGDVYDIGKTTEYEMEKLIGFTYFFHDGLAIALRNFKPAFQSDIVKIIGSYMCESIRIVSDHWHNFKNKNEQCNFALQIEYDRLVFHTIHFLYCFKKIGLMANLPSVPCCNVTTKLLWNILWLFHQKSGCQEELVYMEKDVDDKLRDFKMRSQLHENLREMDANDALSILSMIGRLALYNHAEQEYVCCIAKELFELFFSDLISDDTILNKKTEVLISVVESFPYTVSHLLDTLTSGNDDIFLEVIPFFREVSLSNWIPGNADIDTISKWLLCESLSSPKNSLARKILSKLNWSFRDNKLVLPLELHKRVALLVSEAYSLYDTNGNTWPMSRGVEQMLQLWSLLRSPSTCVDNGFIAWAWELLFSLKLHVLNLPKPPWNDIFDGSPDFAAPDLYQDISLHGLLSSYDAKEPAACYLVLAMTHIGHDQKLLEQKGLQIFSTLVELKQFAAAVQSLYLITPFFVKKPEKLIERPSFLLSLGNLIIADAVYQCNDFGAVIGAVLTQLTNMVMIQILQAQIITVEFSRPLIKLWVNLLVNFILKQAQLTTSLPKTVTNQVHYVLNKIVKLSFIHLHTLNGVLEQMSILTKADSYHIGIKPQFFMRLIFKGSTQVSPLLTDVSSNYAWYAWCVIQSETNRTDVQELWFAVQNELASHGTCTVDQALKKVLATGEHKPYCRPCLPIYRWLLQALKTPKTHPLFPLMCQNFFLYYFQRATNSSNKDRLGPRLFNVNNSSDMLTRFKQKLKMAADFHWQSFEGSSSVRDTTVSQTSNETGVCLESNDNQSKTLFFMYKAFSAWLEDPDLLLQNVCLPALEPKYLPSKLQLVLQYDTNPWLPLLNMKKLKDEVLNMKTLWQATENSRSTTLASPDIKDAVEDIIKRLNSFKISLDVPAIHSCEVPLATVSMDELSSWETLNRVVNKDQQYICDTAVKFSEKISCFKKSYEKYILLAKHRIRTQTTEDDFNRSCSKGNKCSGPAKFHLKFDITVVDDRVENQLRDNRFDFQRLLNDLKMSPTQDICISSLHMETCLRTLVSMAKGPEFHFQTYSIDKEKLRELGVRLFYSQLEKMQQLFTLIGEFSPSKQIFSLCVDILGKELIEGEENQCHELVRVLLKNPSSAGCAAQFFSPHYASIESFISIYEILVNAAGEGSDPCALFMILSKMKVKQFLESKSVPFLLRLKLLELIGVALQTCGSKPDGDRLTVYEIFKAHFCAVLLPCLPQMFMPALEILVKYSETCQLNVDVWYVLFRCVGCHLNAGNSSMKEIKISLKKWGLNQLLTPDQKLFVSGFPLDFNLVIESLQFLSSYFTKARCEDSKELYVDYKEYISVIALFLGLMCHSLLDLAKEDILLPPSIQKTEYIWDIIHDAFEPWIDPIITPNGLKFSWTHENEEEAKFMFNIFALTIEFNILQFQTVKCEKSLISYIWDYYLEMYVNPGFRNYNINICHSGLLSISWELFQPTAADIGGMCKVLLSEIPECREFLVEVMIKISWHGIITDLSDKSPEASAATLRHLGELLFRTGWEYAIIKTNQSSHQNLVKQLEILPWFHLKLTEVNELIFIFCRLCKPVNLLLQKSDNDSTPDLYLLNFLKVVVCMRPRSEMHASTSPILMESLQEKRLSYINKLGCLMANCASNLSSNILDFSNKFAVFIHALLDEVEMLITKDYEPKLQTISAIPLVTEMLTIYNIVNGTDRKNIVLQAFTTWIMSHVNSPLLGPFINTACKFLQNMSPTVTIVEHCILSRYNAEIQDPQEAKHVWNFVSAFFITPDEKLDEFLKACFEQRAYFCMYAYFLRRLAVANDTSSKVLLLKRVTGWIKVMQPDSTSEGKLLLLWDKVLELASIVVHENVQVTKVALLTFCQTLAYFGEDKETSGFFGVIGFGKHSDLSVNFRLICRALCTFIHFQMPENGTVRIEQYAPGFILKDQQDSTPRPANEQATVPHPSSEAMKYLSQFERLQTNRSYSALKSQVEKTLMFIFDPKFCFLETRLLLKELAYQVFPEKPYLYLLE